MGLPTAEIQAALITRYRGDSTLQGLLGGSANPPGAVFDMGAVSTNTTFPYVAVFPITSQLGTAKTLALDAVDTWVQVSIYTQQAQGFMQARGLAKRIYWLTNEQAVDLSASGFSNFFALFENEQQKEEDDGLTQQIVHRYKFMTQG
jgi:hypothetical protein